MQPKIKTALATALSSAILLGGGVIAASPAHAVTGHLVTASTKAECNYELKRVITKKYLRGELHSVENCGQRKTNNHGGYVYQGIVYSN